MCYGSHAVTGSLTHCETGKSAALFNNQPPRLQPLNRCMFPFPQDQKTKLLICLHRRGADRSRAQNSQCGCRPDHPWRRRWAKVSLVFILIVLNRLQLPGVLDMFCQMVLFCQRGNRGALFTTLLCNHTEPSGTRPKPPHTKAPGWAAKISRVFQQRFLHEAKE